MLVVRQSTARKKKNNKLFEAHDSNIDSKRFSRKQTVSPDTVFLIDTLPISPRRRICLTQAVIFFIYRQFLRNSKIQLTLTFFSSVNTLTDLSGNIGFLQRVQKVTSVIG